MPTIVVPFRGPAGKQRLAPLTPSVRATVATAMLGDVLAACAEVGETLVVAPQEAHPAVADAAAGLRIELVRDPGGGQGPAVKAALASVPDGRVLVVNADLPCVTARDLYALLGALADTAVVPAEARDGTTNALALASPALFEPLYGPGSAARFRALATGVRTGDAQGMQPLTAGSVRIPNLVDDVDTLDDLRRLSSRLGPRTRRALADLRLEGAAA
jgi:2-phospho-L-lactate guanylyltransferase